MAFSLPLRPGALLEVRPYGTVWHLVQEDEELGVLTASQERGTTVTTAGDGLVWTVSGVLGPLELSLWHEPSGAGAAWCAGRRLLPGADVQVQGREDEVAVRPRLRGGSVLGTPDGVLATLRAEGLGEGLRLRFALAERPDVAVWAPAVALVAAWRCAEHVSLPALRGGDSAVIGP